MNAHLQVQSVSKDTIDVSTRGGPDAYVLGATTVRLIGKGCDFTCSDWRLAEPRIGDVFNVTIERAE